MSKTHVIDGVTYVEVDRKAEVGEKVVIKGHVFAVDRSYREGIYYYEDLKKRYCAHENYRVLESLEQDITDLLANLARRVSSLEQQVSDTQTNVEKLAEELASARYHGTNTLKEIDLVKKDVSELTQRQRGFRVKLDQLDRCVTEIEDNKEPQSVEVVTFEKFLDSIADKVAERLVSR
jgi:predicted  nucleic acid-binding Zn-ribbon protein